MIAKCTTNEKPAAVEIDTVPDGGGQYVRLHDHAAQVDVPSMDGQEPGKAWECDEVSFYAPTDRDPLTVEAVTAAFADWWNYGAAWDPDAPTPSLDDRLADVEAALLAIIGV